jgi:hypothetical protein
MQIKCVNYCSFVTTKNKKSAVSISNISILTLIMLVYLNNKIGDILCIFRYAIYRVVVVIVFSLYSQYKLILGHHIFTLLYKHI